MICKKCFEDLKSEIEKKGLREFAVKRNNPNVVLIPCSYRAVKDDGELAKKIYKTHAIGHFCPMCGNRLEEA